MAPEIRSALCFYAENGLILLAAFVVMLDHWHALLANGDGTSISKRLKILNQWLSRQTDDALADNWNKWVLSSRRSESDSHIRCGWQEGFYEARVRSSKQFHFVAAYIEENPVRAGLVGAVSDWKWSSASLRFKRFLTKPWPWRSEKD